MNGRTRLVAGICALIPTLSSAAPASATLERFVGHWQCNGHFSNGTPIAGEIDAKFDALSGALVVHHDDAKPGAYHALEIWSVSKDGGQLKASISDGFSGMRWFESSGWQSDALTWVRADGKPGSEQFAYKILASGEMEVTWSVARDGAMKMGDTLSCKKSPAN